jgi:hypothetical protein
MLFHLKIKIKAKFSMRRQLLLCVARRHVCFVLKQSVTVYFFKLNCLKLIGWFYRHNVFPPIRSVCFRFLHCFNRFLHSCYRFLHSCYRFLHCCLGLNALKPTNHSRVIFLCILLLMLNSHYIYACFELVMLNSHYIYACFGLVNITFKVALKYSWVNYTFLQGN